MKLALSTVLAMAILWAAPAVAQPAPPTPAFKPVEFVTRHKTVIRGKPISYTAIAGETVLSDVSPKPIASFFSFTYLADGVDASRPVMFVFNGGPGAASIWLHMGVVGPRRVNLKADFNPSVVPPFTLEDNPDSLLDVADLVFIDPVGTGFSHAIGAKKNEDFYGVDVDANSVAQFIELWLTKYGRWNSPKYVMGESYGTKRAALMPRALMGGPNYVGLMRGATLNGIVMVGTSLDGGGGDVRSPELAMALGIPGMADAAWYHQTIDRKGRTLPAIHDEASAFALGDYLFALNRQAAGQLTPAQASTTATRLADLTGVPAQTWLDRSLRIDGAEFSRLALKPKGLAVGKYDTRYTLPLKADGGDSVADDPAMAQYVPPFIGAFQDMLKKDLKVAMDRPYLSIDWVNSGSAGWNYDRAGVPKGQGYAADLATGMRRNPRLKVLVASGYYDLNSNAASALNAMQRGDVPAERMTYRIYESGHMLYLGGTAPAFSDDVRALIAATR